MGFEYRARFAPARDARSVEHTLRAVRGFSDLDVARATYRFRLETNHGAMPSLEVHLVADAGGAIVALDVCDYGHDGSILGAITDAFALTLEPLE